MDPRELKPRPPVVRGPLAAKATALSDARYQAPGVYSEETPLIPAIAPLPTEIALFAGRTSLPLPDDSEPFPLLRSPADFERWHGPATANDPAATMLRQAVHAYFASGGRKLRIAPVATPDLSGLIGALETSAELVDVATVAAPGGWLLAGTDPLAVAKALLAHVGASSSRRFAIVDPPAQDDVAAIRAWRAQLDSRDAALYYPWVIAPDINGAPAAQPPSGFIAGIYAAVDRGRGVFKAPANEVVPTATGLTVALDRGRQELLNPLGINCIVARPARGIRVWGARTLSSDPDWKYVNIRRLTRWIAGSVEGGIAWTVFEPNTADTWLRVRSAAEAFLLAIWRDGGLMGSTPKEAFFVTCDRSIMTQNDIAAGRLVCQIGIAPARPAEFIIFRIGTKTAN